MSSVALGKGPVAECHGHSTRQSWKNRRSENHFPALWSAMALGKEFFFKKFKLCRVPARGHSAKIIFLKKIQTLSSAGQGALGKEFLEKNKTSLSSAGQRALGKEFVFKKIKNLCRVSTGLALGKATVNGAGAVTVAFLCRVPPGLSAKPLPSAR